MPKLIIFIIAIVNVSFMLSACASANSTGNNFLPATYDVPIDLDIQNQPNSPNM